VPTSGAIVAASRAGTAENAEGRAGDLVATGRLEAGMRGVGAVGALARMSAGRLSLDDGGGPPTWAKRWTAGAATGDESVAGSGVDTGLS